LVYKSAPRGVDLWVSISEWSDKLQTRDFRPSHELLVLGFKLDLGLWMYMIALVEVGPRVFGPSLEVRATCARSRSCMLGPDNIQDLE